MQGFRTFCRLAAAVGAALAVSGCGQPQGPAASRLELTPEEPPQKAVLTEREQGEVLAVMRACVQENEAIDPPRPAALGKRWSDIEDAVYYACEDVEAAVMGTTRREDGRLLVFRLRTIEDWPGELLVRRTDDVNVYHAEVWFGRFPDDPKHAARRDALIAALERNLCAFGLKRKFQAEP